MKTLAIRIENEQHAQLSMIAQLEHLTMIDAIRQAIDQWIELRRNQPELQQRAQAVLDDIERDATTRREAIAALFSEDSPVSPFEGNSGSSELGDESPTPEGTEPIDIKSPRSRRPKGGDSATS
jgi:hypothetical protein